MDLRSMDVRLVFKNQMRVEVAAKVAEVVEITAATEVIDRSREDLDTNPALGIHYGRMAHSRWLRG